MSHAFPSTPVAAPPNDAVTAFDPERARGDFPILQRRVYDRPLVYLDNAATTQKPRAVLDARWHEHLDGFHVDAVADPFTLDARLVPDFAASPAELAAKVPKGLAITEPTYFSSQGTDFNP